MAYTKKDLLSFAKANGIHVTTKMRKAELEAAIHPTLIKRLGEKQDNARQFVRTSPSSIMSVKAVLAMDKVTNPVGAEFLKDNANDEYFFHEWNDLTSSFIQTNRDPNHITVVDILPNLSKGTSTSLFLTERFTIKKQNSIAVHIVSNKLDKQWTPTPVKVKLDMNELMDEACEWFDTMQGEEKLDEQDKPTPTKHQREAFITLVERKHHLFHVCDTMMINDPKDLKYPRYAVKDADGNIMKYNRNTAWAEVLRKWDWRLSHLMSRLDKVMGVNRSHDTKGEVTGVSRGITTQPPKYTFTSSKGRVIIGESHYDILLIKVIEGTWLYGPYDIEVVKAGLSKTHNLKTVKVTIEENKRNSKAHQDEFIRQMWKRIKYVKAMMGTKSWDADKRAMVSNQDGITDKDKHKAGYDFGKAARITKAMTVAQKPLRDEIEWINASLKRATDKFGYKIWEEYFDAMKVDLNLNFISGQVDETCDDLKAHSESLNRGDDLSKAYQEEIEGGWIMATHEDREETDHCNTKRRAPFGLYREDTKDLIEDDYLIREYTNGKGEYTLGSLIEDEYLAEEQGYEDGLIFPQDGLINEEAWLNSQDFNGNWKGEQLEELNQIMAENAKGYQLLGF